jgi:endonuclease/exonuclease/phosphatase family metal-dependent hydrolase
VTARAALAASALALGACAPARNYEDPHGPRHAGAASPRPAAGQALRVVTFNVRFALAVDRAVEALREDQHLRSADIVALQEMDAAGTERVARALGMSWVYYPSAVHPGAGKDFGPAIVTRGRILRDGKLVLPHRSLIRSLRKVAVWADLDLDGRRLRAYSVHLAADAELSRAGRIDQAAAVIAHARGAAQPVVVAGDFNDRYAVGAAFMYAGYEWTSRNLPATISWFTWDHIFTRGLMLAGLERRGVGDHRGASDHRPVWADVVFPSTAPRAATTGAR